MILYTAEQVKSMINYSENNFFVAIIKKNKELVQFYLNYDPTLVNSTNKMSNTPLIIATVFKHKEIVELLLQYGADMNKKNDLGFSAKNYAMENHNIPILRLFNQYRDILSDLLELNDVHNNSYQDYINLIDIIKIL